LLLYLTRPALIHVRVFGNVFRPRKPTAGRLVPLVGPELSELP
jgi:hypothetical protein